jgi:hypothetical protein
MTTRRIELLSLFERAWLPITRLAFYSQSIGSARGGSA